MKTKLAVIAILASGALAAGAENTGGISCCMLRGLRESYRPTAAERALANAAAGASLDELAHTRASRNGADTYFSHKVESKGITDQKRSGRCWLFRGLTVFRSQMMAAHDLPELKLSQAYNFFYDQLEKSNLFLQSIIDSADKPMDDKRVDWLFRNPLSDGGQFTGLADNILKYGVVPASVMGETFSTDNTSRISSLIALKLREDGLELRKMKAEGKTDEEIQSRKGDMLKEVYRMLAMTMGEPVESFTWTRYDKKGKPVSTKTYTPLEFYKEFAGNDLKNDYVMLMNDPSTMATTGVMSTFPLKI